MTARHCPQCFIRLPLSGEANCDCEPRAVAGPVAQRPPVGTNGHPQGREAEIDRSNEVMFVADEDVATLDAIRARQC